MGGAYTVSEQLKYWRSGVKPVEVMSITRQTSQILLLLSEQLAGLAGVSNDGSKQSKSDVPPNSLYAGKHKNKHNKAQASKVPINNAREEPVARDKDASNPANQQLLLDNAKWIPLKPQVLSLMASSVLFQAINIQPTTAGTSAGNTSQVVQFPSVGFRSLQSSMSQLLTNVSACLDADSRAVVVALARRLLPTAYALLLTMQVNDARLQRGLAVYKHHMYQAGSALLATMGACTALLDVVMATGSQQAELMAACEQMSTAKSFKDAAKGLDMFLKVMMGKHHKVHLQLVRR